MGLTFVHPAMPTCLVVYVQKSDFHLINAFCVVIVVKKYTLSSPGSPLILYCIAARYLWCLQPKLHTYAACFSDSQMELFV